MCRFRILIVSAGILFLGLGCGSVLPLGALGGSGPADEFHVGLQLVKGGDAAGGISHLKAAFTAHPDLIANNYWELEQAFRQANKLDDLAALFETIDLTRLRRFDGVERLVSELVQNPQTRGRGLQLFRKVWNALPNERTNLVTSFYNDEVWNLPEMYNYAREAIIPAPGAGGVERWAGVDQIRSWSDGGHVDGPVERLIGAAAKQNKLDALEREVAESLGRTPDWSGGRALLAMIEARRGKLDEAARDVKYLLASDAPDKQPIPHATRLFLAQELEGRQELQPLVLTLYETAMKDQDAQRAGLDYQYDPVRRLVALYRKLGRTDEARRLVLRASRRPDINRYDPIFALARRAESAASVGRELLDLGFPADALRVLNEVLSNPEALDAIQRDRGGGEDNYILRQLREGLREALRGPGPEALPQTLQALLEPDSPRGRVDNPAVDLAMLVHPREADRAVVISLLADTLRAIHTTRRGALESDARSRIDALLKKRPDDPSVQVAAVLLAANDSDPGPLTASSARLLDALSAGSRSDPRRLGLWLAARACWSRETTRATGDRLAALALDAARLHPDPVWALAMLREWGQRAVEQGDRATAEQRWTQMLDLALKNPESNASSWERFELAAQLARLYARQGLVELSLRAMRQALADGPPSLPTAANVGAGQPRIMRRRGNREDPQDVSTQRVEVRLADLDSLWQSRPVAASAVYATLRAAVLPDSRPGEIFLYPRPFAEDARQTRSAADALVRWAARAGALDDLQRRVEARQDAPAAALAARVLLGRVALARGDRAAAARAIAALEPLLTKDASDHAAELACLAAVPALEIPETRDHALAVLGLAAKNLGAKTETETEPLAGLHLALAHACFRAGKVDEGRKHIKDYHDVLTRTMPRYVGDYTLFVRKQHLQQVAREYARAGQWDDVLETIGQYVDAPSYRGSDPPLGTVLTKLARWLATLTPRARYDRLKTWSLPAARGKPIRLLATFVPQDAPPDVFGDFSTPKFEAAVASTAGMLIAAARESGSLDELAQEVTTLAREKVENAETLLILTQIARKQQKLATPRITARLDALKDANAGPALWSDLLLARACLGDESLERDPGQAFTRSLIARSQRRQNWAFLSHLRAQQAVSLARLAGDSSVRPGADPGLAYWHPGAIVDAERHASGAAPAWWVESDGHIRHITGPEDQLLFFDYPLTGRFEFSVDTFIGGWAEGETGYGGLILASSGANAPLNLMPVGRSENLALPNRNFLAAAFNRVSLQVEPERVRYLVNGHLVYEDSDPSPTAPWVTLFGHQARQTTYRNFQLTGTPVIPRTVALSQGDRLEGWVSSFYRQTQPPRRSLDRDDTRREAVLSESVLEDYDWVSHDGVIQCRRTGRAAGVPAVESRLYYYRPLRPGESVAYEFFYEPGSVLTHPSLDRLAFLLEPEGIRLHWITDGPEDDGTGLPPDNSAEVPGDRRGPARLPLEPNAWNSVRIDLEEQTAVVVLNGTEVYRRVLEPSNSLQFGFFHFRDKTAAQVRSVVLRGDWPESLGPQVRTGLASRRPDGRESRAERIARHDLFDEEVLTGAAGAVLKSAAALPLEERYEMLAQWVLPTADRAEFRLQGEFTPADAAPPVASPGASPPDLPGPTRTHTGAQLVAPALELVATAKALNKLDDLAARVDKFTPRMERKQRGQQALRALIAIARDRDADAIPALKTLQELSKALPAPTARYLRWPEQVAQWATLGRPALADESRALADQLYNQWHAMRGKSVNIRERDLWGLQVAYAQGRTRLLATGPALRVEQDASTRMPLWASVEQATAASRGQGTPSPRWTFEDGLLRHWEGHRSDSFYFNVPLRGDFEITCDVSGLYSNQVHVVYAGLLAHIANDRKTCELTTFGRDLRRVPIEPAFEAPKGDYPLRLVVKDQKVSLFLMDRKVYDALPAPGNDPWLAVNQLSFGRNGLRNLRLSGTPIVPATLELAASPDLSGWLADYYQERLDGDSPAWSRQGEEIVGASIGWSGRRVRDRWGNENTQGLQQKALVGSKQESLLQYHRPMLEDGTISYEFFYEPGPSLTLVHPALDRLVFLLDPAGIKIHWRTDAQDDRTGLAPDNVTVEEAERRGTGPLPLKAGQWNALALRLAGDDVTLTLNGATVYVRTLEPSSNRQFGLFHYADESQARVRHVVYEGQWPLEVPPNLGFPTFAGGGSRKPTGE
jgi:hypothetical protein